MITDDRAVIWREDAIHSNHAFIEIAFVVVRGGASFLRSQSHMQRAASHP